jgi:hypothetical protein
MKKLWFPILVVGILTAAYAEAAKLNCHYIDKLDPAYLSKDSGVGAAWSKDQLRQLEKDKAECQRLGTAARARLSKEFSVKSDGMSNAQAIGRLDEEQVKQKNARADAEQKRRDAEARRQEQHQKEMMNQAASVMNNQNAMLKGLGVSMQGITVPGSDASDAEYDEAELHMYQKMLDSGVAPECKGEQGSALIDCMDAALGEKKE